MPAPRRTYHHFLPKHLLRQFENADGRVRFRRRSAEWREGDSGPKRLAREMYLYSPGVDDLWGRPADDDSVEVWLDQHVDTPAAKAIRRLADDSPLLELDDDDRHALAQFIAALDMRTPVVRDLLAPHYGVAANFGASDRRSLRKSMKQSGHHMSLGEVSRASARSRVRISQQGKAGWLNYLQEQLPMARLNVKDRRWTMLSAPMGTEFVTNDVGMIKSTSSFDRPTHWEAGTMGGRFHWLMPICPERAIAVTDRNLSAPGELTVSNMEAITRQFVLDAREFIYSRSALSPSMFAGIPPAPSIATESEKMVADYLSQLRRGK